MSRFQTVIKKTYYRLSLGLETPQDLLVKSWFYLRAFLTGADAWKLYGHYLEQSLVKRFRQGSILDFGGILFPDFSRQSDYLQSFLWSYFDILFFYLKQKDQYQKALLDKCDFCLHSEGPYCYQDEVIDVKVAVNDIVIDAGAWIGPFSAYAAKQGAKVYAFEPSIKNQQFLTETARLNGRIEVVPLGLSDNQETVQFSEGGVESQISRKANEESFQIETTTLDEFVRSRQIPHVDFIKSDIEGFERKMLAGATWILQNYAPKLAICTYHFPDDPKVLAEIILKANPRYTIVQRRMKLYAEVK
jgi:FkbM family methyltransferase